MFRSLPLLALLGCSAMFSGGDEDWDDEDDGSDESGSEGSGSDDDGGDDGGSDGGSGGDGGSGSGDDGGSGSGDDGGSGSGDDGGSDGGSGGSDYSSYDGSEAFEYSGGGGNGDRNCELSWDASGSPSSASSLCSDCEFVFDIDMTYKNSSSDDGTCDKLTGDSSYTYGYVDDYYGYGPYVMYYSSYYGNFSAWASASFSGSSLSYYYGYEDWDYYGDGNYYTYVWSGEGDVD